MNKTIETAADRFCDYVAPLIVTSSPDAKKGMMFTRENTRKAFLAGAMLAIEECAKVVEGDKRLSVADKLDIAHALRALANSPNGDET